jgi:hypothetical protein
MKTLEEKQEEATQMLSTTNEKVIDLQWRSMRENLIFYGIQEAQNFSENGENCEERVKDFIKNILGLEDQIEMDRAHRLGRYKQDRARPRPIVVKFNLFKQKEKIKQIAREKLTDSEYWVKDQYPREMEEKRKGLYSIADESRKNPENRVNFVRDRLYVNGIQQFPNERQNNQRNHDGYNPHYNRPSENNNRNYQRTTLSRNERQQSRTFYRKSSSHGTNNQWPNQIKMNNQTPITNNKGPSLAGKKKATSPLETDSTFKKPYIVYSDSDSDSNDEQSILLLNNDPKTADSYSQMSTQRPDSQEGALTSTSDMGQEMMQA